MNRCEILGQVGLRDPGIETPVSSCKKTPQGTLRPIFFGWVEMRVRYTTQPICTLLLYTKHFVHDTLVSRMDAKYCCTTAAVLRTSYTEYTRINFSPDTPCTRQVQVNNVTIPVRVSIEKTIMVSASCLRTNSVCWFISVRIYFSTLLWGYSSFYFSSYDAPSSVLGKINVSCGRLALLAEKKQTCTTAVPAFLIDYDRVNTRIL